MESCAICTDSNVPRSPIGRKQQLHSADSIWGDSLRQAARSASFPARRANIPREPARPRAVEFTRHVPVSARDDIFEKNQLTPYRPDVILPIS